MDVSKYEEALLDYKRNKYKRIKAVGSQRVKEWFELTPPLVQLLSKVRGTCVDIGAGAGRASEFLNSRGVKTVAIDISPICVKIMKERGIDARHIDVMRFIGRFDNALLMMNNIGMMGTRESALKMLKHVKTLLTKNGKIYLDAYVKPDDRPIEEREVKFQYQYEGETDGVDRYWYATTRRELEEFSNELGARIRYDTDGPNYVTATFEL